MKIFIWERVEKCSDSFHEEGGVVVIADNEDVARDVANSVEGCNIQPEEKPVASYDVFADEEKVFIFPDAGCC